MAIDYRHRDSKWRVGAIKMQSPQTTFLMVQVENITRLVYYPNTHKRSLNVRLHTVINRADFVWFTYESTASFSHQCILLPLYGYNMHQDTKSSRLIAVCKRSLTFQAKARTFFSDEGPSLETLDLFYEYFAGSTPTV